MKLTWIDHLLAMPVYFLRCLEGRRLLARGLCPGCGWSEFIKSCGVCEELPRGPRIAYDARPAVWERFREAAWLECLDWSWIG